MSGMCVWERDCVPSYDCLYYIQRQLDYNHLVWVVHLFIAKHEEFPTLPWWRWEYTVQVPPLGRDVPDAVHYMGKRAGSPDVVHILGLRRHSIYDTTASNTQEQVPAVLSSRKTPGLQVRNQSICDAPVLNILVSMEIQSDAPLWQQLRTQTNPSYLLGTRLKSELAEHLCSWNTGTMKRSDCTFTLHTIFTLHRTRQLMRTRGQPHGWLVQPQMELDWPLGSLCSHLWSCKITNAFL